MQNIKNIIVSLGILLLMPFMVSAQTFEKDLYFGIQGDSEVTKLQEFLASEGIYSGPVTGNFFSLTLKAVKDFQVREGISPAAGYFGPITKAKANAILSVQVSASNEQAVAETGSTPQQPEESRATNDVLAQLLAQVQLLQQQLNALHAQQASQQVVQQQQQVVIEQIQKDTTPQPTPIDNIPPTVSLKDKISGKISGTIYIRSDIAQDYGIMPKGNPLQGTLGYGAWLDRLNFYLDGNFLSSLNYGNGTNQLGIDSTKFSNGKHALSVEAYDLAGNVGHDSIEVDIENPTFITRLKCRLLQRWMKNSEGNHYLYGYFNVEGEPAIFDIGQLERKYSDGMIDKGFDCKEIQVPRTVIEVTSDRTEVIADGLDYATLVIKGKLENGQSVSEQTVEIEESIRSSQGGNPTVTRVATTTQASNQSGVLYYATKPTKQGPDHCSGATLVVVIKINGVSYEKTIPLKTLGVGGGGVCA